MEQGYFQDVEALRSADVSLAVINLDGLVLHWVVVMEVLPEHVVIGNPLCGKVTLTREEFNEQWTHVAVLLRRK